MTGTGARAPSFGAVLLGGAPRFLRDAFGPTVVFYAGWKLSGLLTGVATATVWTAAVYAWERRQGRRGLAARIGLGIALVQAATALATGSAIGYFAPPLIAQAIYGLAFLASVAIGHPLAGIFAMESYPIPADVKASPAFHRAFARISVAWGTYLLTRTAIRLTMLLHYSIDVYVLVNVLTAAPMTILLMTWTFWYAHRSLRHVRSPAAAHSH